MENPVNANGGNNGPSIDPELLATIQKELDREKITKTSLSPDRTKIAVLDDGGTVSLWDGHTGKLLDYAVAKNQKDILSLGFNENSTKVIVTTPKGVEIYGIIDPKVLNTIENKHINPFYGGSEIQNKRLSPDGTKIAVLDTRDTVFLYDGHTGELLDNYSVPKRTSYDEILSVGFNKDSTKVIIHSTKNGEREYDIIDPKVLKTIKNELDSNASMILKSLSPDGTKIAVLTGSGIVFLWDGKTGKFEDFIKTVSSSDVQSLGFSPDSTTVIINTTYRRKINYPIANLVIMKKIRSTLEHANKTVKHEAIHPAGKIIAILEGDSTLSIWDGNTGTLKPSEKTLKVEDAVVRIKFSNNGDTLNFLKD